MKLKNLAIILSFLLFLTSCAKDELTLPAEVNFVFGMICHQSCETDQPKSTSQINMNDNFSIDQGKIVIDAIEFDGRREKGKDVYFISNFASAIIADLENHTTSNSVRFDIPQGEYNKIDITFHLGNTQELPIVLQGTLNIGANTQIPIRFEFMYNEQFQIRAKGRQFGQNIILRKDKPSTATALLDAEFLFRFINIGMIINADLINLNGVDVLLINNQHNVSIFNQLANRLHNSLTITFD